MDVRNHKITEHVQSDRFNELVLQFGQKQRWENTIHIIKWGIDEHIRNIGGGGK